jgi:hypothetical protein
MRVDHRLPPLARNVAAPNSFARSRWTQPQDFRARWRWRIQRIGWIMGPPHRGQGHTPRPPMILVGAGIAAGAVAGAGSSGTGRIVLTCHPDTEPCDTPR